MYKKTLLNYRLLKDSLFQINTTVETGRKEPTFLGNSLLRLLLFAFYNPYIRDGEVGV